MSNTPLVTILFPVYNAEDYLQEAIDSILNQTYSNLEILVINDGSTDSSPKILASIKDLRLRIVNNPKNLGLIETLNRGIDLAKGKYIVRADSDDICLPQRVAKQVQFMEANSHVGLSGTGFGTFGDDLPLAEKGKFSGDHYEIRFTHLYQMHLMHGTSIWRKDVFITSGLRFDPDYAHAEDYDLFDRMDQITTLSNIPDALYHIRLHKASVSKQFHELQESNSIRIKKRGFARLGLQITDYRLELFRDLCQLNYAKLTGKELEVADLILELESLNKQSNYFPIDFLHTRLKGLWLSLHLNNATSGLQKQLKGHAIHNHFSLGASNRLKIRVKSLLR